MKCFGYVIIVLIFCLHLNMREWENLEEFVLFKICYKVNISEERYSLLHLLLLL